MIRRILDSHLNFVFWLAVIFLIAFGCWRICSTYQVFGQVWDELFHIAAGMEWLDQGKYTHEICHPPLARVMGAAGLYLNGLRNMDRPEPGWDGWAEGDVLLHAGNKYERNLTLARIGILPFFVMASFVAALWARNCAGTSAALLAVFLLTTLPPILAHAGFATLDMACAAFVTAALFCLSLWLAKPDLWHSLFLGITAGLAVLSKFSALAFFFIAGGLMGAIFILGSFQRRPAEKICPSRIRQRFSLALVILLVCLLTIWAGYRFSAAPLSTVYKKSGPTLRADGLSQEIPYSIQEKIYIPAPEFIQGIADFYDVNKKGHLSYLLGNISVEGWWYFFPVIFLLKTPLPFILLSAGGFFFIFRNIFLKTGGFPLSGLAVAVLGILGVGLLGRVDNGIRQILSIYPLLAIVAGYGAAKLLSLNQPFRLVKAGLVVGLCLWQLTESLAAHPDYLAYFNELAGSHPEKIVVDSDLDWGQDFKRLTRTLKNRGISEVVLSYNGSLGMDLEKFDLPQWQRLRPYQRETGWIAISIFNLTLGTGEAPFDQFAWLREYPPVERIGKSIWLYHIVKE